MGKKFQREFRNRRLTPEEVARDEEVRRRVQEEFPPAASTASASPGLLSESLKRAICDSEKTEYQIAKDAGVSQIVVSRFMTGERDIRMATADKLAEVLGLKLGAGT